MCKYFRYKKLLFFTFLTKPDQKKKHVIQDLLNNLLQGVFERLTPNSNETKYHHHAVNIFSSKYFPNITFVCSINNARVTVDG